MENKEKDIFSYKYSAKEQNEIQNIRKKYIVSEESKMEHLRRMDAGVTGKATRAALFLGIIGALTLGFGMSLIMSDFCVMLGITQNAALFSGIIIGIIGITFIGCAFPLYSYVIKKERARIAPEILQLTEELMK